MTVKKKLKKIKIRLNEKMEATGDISGLGFCCNTLDLKIIERFYKDKNNRMLFLIGWGDEGVGKVTTVTFKFLNPLSEIGDFPVWKRIQDDGEMFCVAINFVEILTGQFH